MQQAGAPPEIGDPRRAIGEGEHQRRRGQGEARPGGEPAEPACARQADGEADLARGRAGQELAKRDQIGERALGKPAAPRDEFAAEIADMGDRPAEGREAELEESEENFAGGAPPCGGLRRARLGFRHGRPLASAAPTARSVGAP